MPDFMGCAPTVCVVSFGGVVAVPVAALGCRRDQARVLIYAHKNAYRPRLPPALEAQASPGNEDELEC